MIKKSVGILSLFSLLVLLFAPAQALSGAFTLTVEKAPSAPMEGVQCYAFTEGGPVEGAKVYAFNEAGAYLGLNQTTNASGQATFRLAAGTCSFRADVSGGPYWNVAAALPAGQVAPVPLSVTTEPEPTVSISASPLTDTHQSCFYEHEPRANLIPLDPNILIDPIMICRSDGFLDFSAPS